MNDRTLSEELLKAVQELASVTPHQRPGVRHTREDWPVYCDGYYTAVCFSLKVMELALERRARRERADWIARRRLVARYARRVLARPRPVGVARRTRGAA